MNFALVSLHNAAYQPLADLTWNQNKIIYAEKHGYGYACKTEVDQFYGVTLGYEKVYFIRDMLEGYPEVDWVWWTGADTLITNMDIKLEDKVDNDYHFIIASDCNGINADSFFVRNTPEGRGFIEMIIDNYEKYKNDNWQEQQCIIDHLEEYKGIIKVVPQREINAYDYALLYSDQSNIDKLGNNGQWQDGDLLIHWPGMSLPHRIHLAQYFMTRVIGKP